jgi:phosphoribosyl-ATP pyrophosphohydrolase/phosphoribosyl-AMP cyclohydrolase
MSNSDLEFLATLEKLIIARRAAPAEGSYTAELYASGTQRIAQKVGEEAIEVALASCHDDRDETVGEAADLLYHLLVLLANQDIALAEVVATLKSRHSKK